jgi:uncharacterized membrane protein YebE (DUF533 family)
MVPRLVSGMICDVDKFLKEAFLNLYAIACAKDASIVAHLELSWGSN